MPKILITNRVPLEHLKPLVGIAEIIQGPGPIELMPRQEVLTLVPELDAIINQTELRVDQELLDASSRLKIVANVAIGTDNLDLDAMAARGVWATNTPDAPVESTADFTLGMLLALVRRILPADRYVRSSAWPEDGFQPGRWDGTLLSGKTLGIIGYGRIGQAVDRRARAFGMKILFHDLLTTTGAEYRTLDALLGDSDIVSLHVPLTDDTYHLLNSQRIELMKPGVLLLNMSRGKVVDETALVESLRSGQIAGAALDVFEMEPVVHPELQGMDQVLLTPHIAGGTQESKFQARTLCAQNIALVLQGELPVTPVNTPLL